MRACRRWWLLQQQGLVPSFLPQQQRFRLLGTCIGNKPLQQLLSSVVLFFSLVHNNSVGSFVLGGANLGCHCTTSSFSTTASSSSSANNNNNMATTTNDNNHNEKRKKTLDDLRIQWAGGKDLWPRVPLADGEEETFENHQNGFAAIQTRVVVVDTQACIDNDNPGNNGKKAQWPKIIQESILYGLGAYNPRGQIVADEINQRQHALLTKDVQAAFAQYNNNNNGCNNDNDDDFVITTPTYWASASIWQDGSFEKGFILAFPRRSSSSVLDNNNNNKTETPPPPGLELSVELAKKYNQGAIYQYQYIKSSGDDDEEEEEDGNENTTNVSRGQGRKKKPTNDGRLMRDTIAVLDDNTDARVEVEIDDDDDSGMDLSPFA